MGIVCYAVDTYVYLCQFNSVFYAVQYFMISWYHSGPKEEYEINWDFRKHGLFVVCFKPLVMLVHLFLFFSRTFIMHLFYHHCPKQWTVKMCLREAKSPIKISKRESLLAEDVKVNSHWKLFAYFPSWEVATCWYALHATKKCFASRYSNWAACNNCKTDSEKILNNSLVLDMSWRSVNK